MVSSKLYNNIEPFSVNNYENTCYISSLLVALFFAPSNDYLLDTDLQDNDAIYLQELIRIHFVNKIRTSKTVTTNILKDIETQCVKMGWKCDNSSDNLSNFYLFLFNKFKGTPVKIQRETITEALRSSLDIGIEKNIYFIPLELPLVNINSQITVKNILHEWLYDDLKEVLRDVITQDGKEQKLVPGLDVNHIINKPLTMALNINRFNNNISIDIQRRISPYHNKFSINKLDWIFYSAICYTKDSSKSGHYYTLFTFNDNYYIFDDKHLPCVTLIKMNSSSSDIINKIKKECVFLIYKLIS